jgi:hypothetical protein
MSDARDQEIRALKDLLASEGWQMFAEAQRGKCQGESFVGKLKDAVRGKNNEQATESVKEVFAGRDAIEQALLWPGRRLDALQKEIAKELEVESDVVRRA